MTGMFEFFDHTADLGLRIEAPDLDTLFAEAAQALFAVIVEDPSAIAPAEERTVEMGRFRACSHPLARNGEAAMTAAPPITATVQ